MEIITCKSKEEFEKVYSKHKKSSYWGKEEVYSGISGIDVYFTSRRGIKKVINYCWMVFGI